MPVARPIRGGWDLLERYWQLAPWTVGLYPQPHWDGRRVSGTLLAWGDQGLGDQIIYGGMLAEMADRADQLVVQVSRASCRCSLAHIPA